MQSCKRWHFVLPLTKARTIVASELEREVTGGISAANHIRGRVGSCLLLVGLRVATPGCSQAQVPLWLHKMSAPALLMHRLLLAGVTQLSESGAFSCHLSA